MGRLQVWQHLTQELEPQELALVAGVEKVRLHKLPEGLQLPGDRGPPPPARLDLFVAGVEREAGEEEGEEGRPERVEARVGAGGGLESFPDLTDVRLSEEHRRRLRSVQSPGPGPRRRDAGEHRALISERLRHLRPEGDRQGEGLGLDPTGRVSAQPSLQRGRPLEEGRELRIGDPAQELLHHGARRLGHEALLVAKERYHLGDRGGLWGEGGGLGGDDARPDERAVAKEAAQEDVARLGPAHGSLRLEGGEEVDVSLQRDAVQLSSGQGEGKGKALPRALAA
mmetsp:Transcript_9038/g.29930  ORF Transcript_9038/g.29930 Transcript_9038/m.29930 type:complete len:283 (-) Transcript_9038:271-1119(-)